MEYHRSVLVADVLRLLKVDSGKRFIDATVGDAGHAIAIAQAGGLVLGLDWDRDAIIRSRQRIEETQPNIRQQIQLVRGNFTQLEKLAQQYGFVGIDGILFDLGASIYQLTTAKRGFSFDKPGPLDMRMDRRRSFTAVDLVNTASREELYAIFASFAQEHHSRAIAQAIIRARAVAGPITTTRRLTDIVSQAVKDKGTRSQSVRRVFQAIRIAVNQELHNLKRALPQAIRLLSVNGRLAVISFHSGEDRLVKIFFRQSKELELVNKRPIRPKREEIVANPRARSARLRIAQRL